MEPTTRPLCAAAALLMLTATLPLGAQATTAPAKAKPTATATRPALAPRDLTKTPTVYVVGYAHLDTEWRWEYPQVIREYLWNTMHYNFDLFEKYPHYIFNFTGANRYRLMKEYFPEDYAKLKEYVAEGRWYPAGSSMEEGDVNAPSAEGIMRQVLYGNEYFRKEFGKASAEFMLPDCFGFPWSLPSILAHAGIKGFSTQKLVWGSSVPDQASTPPDGKGKGIPFNIGNWVGPDGKSVVAALNPGSYSASLPANFNDDSTWLNRAERNGTNYGVFTDYHYYGTGDTGGEPSEQSVFNVEQAVTTKGPLTVVSSNADQMFLDITRAEAAKLPSYSGEMELQNHSAGSLTSEGFEKRLIRKNELLADAAEKASIVAQWLGGRTYPMQRLNDAWTLEMAAHFHDVAAGTATPTAYEYAWNDGIIALNQFASVLTSATDAATTALNTQVQGTPVVVYNPLTISREDLVEASVPMATAPSAIKVVGPDGKVAVSQLDSWADGQGKVVFVAKAPSAGYAVYDVRTYAAGAPRDTGAGVFVVGAPSASSELRVSPSSLENARYRVTINSAGDVSSIFDKKLNKELLAAPARLALQEDSPNQWPAWNMDFNDEQSAPRGYVSGPARIAVTENGPARVAVTIERQVDSSKFVQTVRLSAGDGGNRVEFADAVDWKMMARDLKATFPLAAADTVATYNWGVGTIQRSNAYSRKFEVPTHQWIDLTDRSGAFGVAILTDCKNGSDKPNDNTIRLTLIRTPGELSSQGMGYNDQISQDFGHHEITYGLYGHAGDYRAGQSDWQGLRLNQPLIAFDAPKHMGALGKSFSLVKINDSRVGVMALKRAEASNELVIRINELDGKPQPNVEVMFAAPLTSAREVNGQEQPIGPATINGGGALTTSLTPFTIRSFAVRMAPPITHVTAPTSTPVTLAYDLAAASNDHTRSRGGFDAAGEALPAEMLPRSIAYAGVSFTLPAAKTGTPDAVVARGQEIQLPAGTYNRLYILAASADGDQTATFKVGNTPTNLTIEDWGGFIGQWDTRVSWKTVPALPPILDSAYNDTLRTNYENQLAYQARLDSVRRVGGDTEAVIAQGRGGRGRGGAGRGAGGGGGRGGRGAGESPALAASLAAAQESQNARQQASRERLLKLRVDSVACVGGDTTAFLASQTAGRGGRGGGGGGGGGGFGRGGATYPRTISVADQIAPGYIKRAPIAWYASHKHDKCGANEYYEYSYLFAYTLDIPAGARSFTLPNNDKIRILAATVAKESAAATPAQPLYDVLRGAPRR